MKKIKLAVVGCLGRMGKEIIKEINISPNCELVSAIEAKKTTIKRRRKRSTNTKLNNDKQNTKPKMKLKQNE